MKRISVAMLLACGVLHTASARANINLELRPPNQSVTTGETIAVGLYAVSDNAGSQFLSGTDVIISWDPTFLQLLGIDDTGGVPLLVSGFPADPFGLNEVVPPQDGDGLYQAFAELGTPAEATPAGSLITTFEFEALAETPQTTIAIEVQGGTPTTETVVWDGDIPNFPVTGTLGVADVEITVLIPAASTWSLVWLALILLSAGTLVFEARQRAVAE